MWDNNALLQLLKTMPNKLNHENLEKIQLLIDADKYKNSIISGFDLCGIFAPFCRGCDKTSIYPCAVSYIRMLQSQGMDIEIDASPSYFAHKPYKPMIDVPQTRPRINSTYEQRPVRKPRENVYGNARRVPQEVKSEIAVTEVEPTVQPVLIEEKTVEKKVEAKSENSLVRLATVTTATVGSTEEVSHKNTEVVAPKKQERAERIEEKPLDDKKLRIAVARRKLNF